MLLHKYTPVERSLTAMSESEQQEQYQIDLQRMGLALLFLLILIVAAFAGKLIKFDQAAITFLHLSEVAAGGIAGLFFGERLTLKEQEHTTG